MVEMTDEALAGMAQKGDLRAFSELVGRFEAKLLRYAHRFLLQGFDAEDLVQEVFLKVYVNIKSFDTSRSFNSWIYRIAHNEFINAIKKRGQEPLPFFDADSLFPHPLSRDNPEADVSAKELKEMMQMCLEKLDVKYREPLVLYYYEDVSYKEIAEILHIPESTVGVRIGRAKKLLKEIFLKLNYDQS
jgi:RNA polymerase sigma-70 factor (ECF subfamily)